MVHPYPRSVLWESVPNIQSLHSQGGLASLPATGSVHGGGVCSIWQGSGKHRLLYTIKRLILWGRPMVLLILATLYSVPGGRRSACWTLYRPAQFSMYRIGCTRWVLYLCGANIQTLKMPGISDSLHVWSWGPCRVSYTVLSGNRTGLYPCTGWTMEVFKYYISC